MEELPAENSSPPPVPPTATNAEILGVWAVIAIIVFPSIGSGLLYTLYLRWDPRYLDAILYLTKGISDISLAFVLAWMMKLKPADLGIQSLRIADFFLACFIGVAWFQGIDYLSNYYRYDENETVYYRIFGSSQSPVPGVGGAILTGIVTLFGATGEELLFRALLIPRLRKILKSRIAAVVLSSLLFSICHLYQGQTSVLIHFLSSMVIGSFYMVCPRIIPFAVGHTICNLMNVYQVQL